MSESHRTILCIGSEVLSLYLRCAFLKDYGWRVLTSTSGHAGIIQFAVERMDVVVLDVDGDGAETAVIAGELKRTKENVRLILLVGEGEALVESALNSADAVVPRLDESELLKAVEAASSQK